MKQTVLTSCLHPLTLRTSAGTIIDVPCGKCFPCRLKYQTLWEERILQEFSHSPAALYVTLTYDNKHLPLVDYTRTGKDCAFVACNRPSLQHIVGSVVDVGSSLIPHFATKNGRDGGSRFAVNCKKDVQDYIKRLRKYLTSLFLAGSLAGSDSHFRYFVCTEYGPSSWRPHYHLLFFGTQNTLDALVPVLYKKWKMCSRRCINVSPVTQYTCRYVAKYVGKICSLPPVLSEYFPCWHIQSKRPAFGSFAISETDKHFEEYNRSRGSRVVVTTSTDGFVPIVRKVPTNCVSIQRYFPKFLCAGRLPSEVFDRIFVRLRNEVSDTDRYSAQSCFESCRIEVAGMLGVPVKKVKDSAVCCYLLHSGFTAVDLDVYLFGANCNWYACKKIWKVCKDMDMLVDEYYHIYKRSSYFTFENCFRRQTDWLEETLSRGVDKLTAFMYQFPHFYDDLQIYTTELARQDDIEKVDLIVSGYGFTSDDFLSEGRWRPFANYSTDTVYQEYLKKVEEEIDKKNLLHLTNNKLYENF